MSLITPEERVLQFLRSTPEKLPAKVIARSTGLERETVNRALYGKLTKENQVVCDKTQCPPLWSALTKKEEIPDANEDVKETQNVVFVDLGNVHDVLQKLEHYANENTCRVDAFADCVFNGFGINPPPKNKNIRVIQTKDEHKNAADMEMIWTAAELVIGEKTGTKDKFRFIIFTRDNGFRSLKTILERYPTVKEVLFVQTWQQAQEFIE